jgi:ABC-type nitrate/sulfonate/bicarbonate transport system permease component
MFEMATQSMRLFFTGKLFQDTPKALRQIAIGGVAGAAAAILVGQFAPLWLAAAAGGAVGGFLLPFLFKDLKYR